MGMELEESDIQGIICIAWFSRRGLRFLGDASNLPVSNCYKKNKRHLFALGTTTEMIEWVWDSHKHQIEMFGLCLALEF